MLFRSVQNTGAPPPEFVAAPPQSGPAEGSRRQSKRLKELAAAAATAVAPTKKDRGRRKVEITVEELREHLDRKFSAMNSIDDIFDYIKKRFTKEDLIKFLLKQVKADLESML